MENYFDVPKIVGVGPSTRCKSYREFIDPLEPCAGAPVLVGGGLNPTPSDPPPTRLWNCGSVMAAVCTKGYWTTRGCRRRLCVLSFRSFGGICESASRPVRELAIRELSSYRTKHSVSPPVLLEQFTKDAERGAVQAAFLRRLGGISRPRRRSGGMRPPLSSPRVPHDGRQHLVHLVIQQSRHLQEPAPAFHAQLLTFCNT